MTRWIGGALVLAVMALACPAWAKSPTDELRTLFAGASRIMDPRAPGGVDERLGAIRGLIREAVDFHEAARLSLGSTWTARTPAEREEFVPLFAEFVERALIAGIAGKIRLGEGIQVSYLDEAIDGAAATVRTTIASRSGVDLPLDYRMIQRGGRWAIRDVVIDGVSLASNYRAQLVRVMQSASYSELLQQMRARVGAVAAAPLTASTIPDGSSLDFIALDMLAPLAPSVRTTPTDGPAQSSTPPRGEATTVEADSASDHAATASVGVEPSPGAAQTQPDAGSSVAAEERVGGRAHWLALDLTLVARAVPDSTMDRASASASTRPPTDDAARTAGSPRAGEIAKYAELIDLVMRTRPGGLARALEPPKPLEQTKREPVIAVAAVPPVAPARPEEPTRIAAFTMPVAPRPAARPVAVEPQPFVPVIKTSEPPRPAPTLRPVRLQPETPSGSQRAAEAPVADARSYWVQMAAFKTADAAQRLVDELIGQGSAAGSVVVEPASPGVPWARVRIGPFPDRWAAAAKAREMQALGHSPYVSGPRD